MATEINPFDETEVLSESVSVIAPTKDNPDFLFLRIPLHAIQKPRKPFELKLAGKDSSGKDVFRVPTNVCTMYESTAQAPFTFTVRVDRKASESARLALYKQGLADGKQVIALKGDDETYEIVLRPSQGGKEQKVKIHGQIESARATLRKKSAAPTGETVSLVTDGDDD